MRSRYSAFCEGNVGYLLATHRVELAAATNRAELEQYVAETQWLNLIIVSTAKGGESDKTGLVEFVAAFRPKAMAFGVNGGAVGPSQLHERSRFMREGERWFYVDGEQLEHYSTKRGAPCWCGSGKKTKACHA